MRQSTGTGQKQPAVWYNGGMNEPDRGNVTDTAAITDKPVNRTDEPVTTADCAASKTAWRRAILTRRRHTTPVEREQAGEVLATTLAESLRGTAGGTAGMTVAAYVSMGTEISTRPLLWLLLAHRVRVLVPALGSGLDVGWVQLTDAEALKDMGRHRPQEPAGQMLPPDALADAALVLVPALAVDTAGTRLGRGGGWYDRALCAVHDAVPVLAVCWPWELVTGTLPREAHDRPVQGVLSPRGITWLAVSGH